MSGEPPVIPIGTGRWSWSPENPLGGSWAWNRQIGWGRTVQETRHTFAMRWIVHDDADAVSPRTLAKCAKRACKAARRALGARGGVIAHGAAHPHVGGTLLLVLHLDTHSAGAVEGRDAAARAFFESFGAELVARGVRIESAHAPEPAEVHRALR